MKKKKTSNKAIQEESTVVADQTDAESAQAGPSGVRKRQASKKQLNAVDVTRKQYDQIRVYIEPPKPQQLTDVDSGIIIHNVHLAYTRILVSAVSLAALLG